MTKVNPEECSHEFVEYLVTKGEVLEISVVDNRFETRIKRQEALASCIHCNIDEVITEWENPVIVRKGGHVVW